MAVKTNMRVFTAGTWVWEKPDNLAKVDVVLRGAGGGGASSASDGSGGAGGGGGAAVEKLRIPAALLPDRVNVSVGAGGTSGGDGGDSTFLDLTAFGGHGGNSDRLGGLSYMRGGTGGARGQPGESVTSADVRLLAGGGGGGGRGSIGGKSGRGFGNPLRPFFWEWCQSGSGGDSGQPGGYPAGGGGAGAVGGDGLVTVIEYFIGEEH
ncbi:hypothetical protein RQCS_40590 [Rhodococcus qingshengii]|uniref:glycine-rich domain-containing protein n=1 Tax=Rhodococcus qingshengii TaxID=334542 RepID=UPI0007E59947|nr:hypothetical protein [Rhodococcus qingshengii]BCF84514.1 hypothetical protein RQCS_40590 [Rhodococcus qingshengii]